MTTGKRKADSNLQECVKKLRIDRIQTESDYIKPLLENSDNDNNLERYQDSSDEQNIADTPITPFSPARIKFPSELKTIQCTYEGCHKSFNRPARLTAHLRSHTNERPFVCQFDACDKSYLQEKHLQHHIKSSHTHEREFHCDWEGCDKSFVTTTRLNRHKEAHKGRDRFRCTAYPPCNQTFRKHQTLQQHIRSYHLNLAPFPCNYVDPITAEKCSAGFDGSTGLRQHQQRNHGTARFFCSECVISGSFREDGTPLNAGFSSDAKLQAHIRKEHATCMFCELKCKSQRELLSHIDTKHSGKTLKDRQKYPCNEIGCNKKFTTKNNLNIHVRTAHLGQRFICGSLDLSAQPEVPGWSNMNGCGNDFVSKHTLMDHIRTVHLGLPRIPHRKKGTTAGCDMGMDTGGGDDKHLQLSTSKSNNRTNKSRPQRNDIDDLLGTSYAADVRRHIPCLVLGCDHVFIREYDLEVHMQSAH